MKMYYVVQFADGTCKTKEIEGVIIEPIFDEGDQRLFEHGDEVTALRYLSRTPQEARMKYLAHVREAIETEEHLIEQARVRKRSFVAKYAAAVNSAMEIET